MNTKEREQARLAVDRAVSSYGAIVALPQQVGAIVQWQVNGLHWERTGDDEWRPLQDHPYGGDERRWPSSHVASGSWVAVDRDEALAAVEAERQREAAAKARYDTDAEVTVRYAD